MPRITVITAVKNAADFLPETIASIQAQTVADWRYLIVDDASEDATAEIADAAAARDPRIEIVRLDQSIGPYAAANLAATRVDSEFIARIDGDDVAPGNRFALQLAALDANGRAKACTGSWRMLEDGNFGEVRRVPSKRNGVIKWMMWFRSNLLHSTLMIDTSLFHEIGGYGPERVGEDYRLWGEVVRRNVLVVVDDLLADYRISPGQITAQSGARDKPERIRINLDHMQQCDRSDTWTLQDADDIRWIGEPAPFGTSRALELLRRFERAWRRDTTLDAADRRELARHTAKRRVRHLRHAFSASPGEVVSTATRHAPTIIGSCAQVLTNRGPAWP